MMKKYFFVLGLLVSTTPLMANVSIDTVPAKNYKNVVRFNISNPIIFGFGNNFIFGYERVVSPHQSFSVNIGWQRIASDYSSPSNDSISMNHNKTASGFNFGVDYRFYLAKENKYEAPHGLYIGPYYSYNAYSNENNWNYNMSNGSVSTVKTNADFTINTVGAELGYQFVLWKRMTLDFVLIGPGISSYKLDATISGNLTDAQKDKLREALKNYFSQKFPGMDYVFSGQSLSANGTLNTTSIGFRYLIHIGFRF